MVTRAARQTKERACVLLARVTAVTLDCLLVRRASKVHARQISSPRDARGFLFIFLAIILPERMQELLNFCLLCLLFFFSFYLKTQNQNYFARKFEAIVNQEVINQLDSWLYGSYPADMKGINYYWENIFHHEDSITKTSDVFRTFFQSFVRIGIKNAKMKSTRGNKDHSCLTGGNGKIREVTVLNQHDQFSGVLALFDVELPSGNGATRVVTMETWMAPLSHEELLNLNMSRGPQRLVGLEVR